MYKYFLPNNKEVDLDQLCCAIDSAGSDEHWFLNIDTADVEIISESMSDNADELIEQYSQSEEFFEIPPIPSPEKYQWMVEYIDNCIRFKNEKLADRLTLTINGKGAFKRFEDILNEAGEGWIAGWRCWKDDLLFEKAQQWLYGLPIAIREELDLPDNCPLCQMLKAEYEAKKKAADRQ